MVLISFFKAEFPAQLLLILGTDREGDSLYDFNFLKVLDSVIAEHKSSPMSCPDRTHIIDPRYLLYLALYSSSTQRPIHPECLNSNYPFASKKAYQQ